MIKDETSNKGLALVAKSFITVVVNLDTTMQLILNYLEEV